MCECCRRTLAPRSHLNDFFSSVLLLCFSFYSSELYAKVSCWVWGSFFSFVFFSFFFFFCFVLLFQHVYIFAFYSRGEHMHTKIVTHASPCYTNLVAVFFAISAGLQQFLFAFSFAVRLRYLVSVGSFELGVGHICPGWEKHFQYLPILSQLLDKEHIHFIWILIHLSLWCAGWETLAAKSVHYFVFYWFLEWINKWIILVASFGSILPRTRIFDHGDMQNLSKITLKVNLRLIF